MNLQPPILISNWIIAEGSRLRGYAADGAIADFRAILPNDFRAADPLIAAALPAAIYLLKNTDAQTCQTTGIILGTMFGCLETDVLFEKSRQADGGRYASPAAFARTLPTTLLGELAIHCNIHGPGFVLSAGPISTLLAIARACRWLQSGALTHCVAGGFEWRNQTAEVTLLWLTALTPDGNAKLAESEMQKSQIINARKAAPPDTQIYVVEIGQMADAANDGGDQNNRDAGRQKLNAALLDTGWQEKTLTLNWKTALSCTLMLRRQAVNGDQ